MTMKSMSAVLSTILLIPLLSVSCANQHQGTDQRPSRKPPHRTVQSIQSGRRSRQTSPEKGPGAIPPHWIAGRLDSALSRARSRQLPVLVFWNAKWCPPCNQVKLQVIQNPGFRKLVGQTILVWMDGDAPGAQKAGQRLGLRGYPTLLLLDWNGRELMRMVGAVTFADFQAVFRAARARHEPVREIVRRALKGDQEPEDWLLLAYHDWDLDAAQDLVDVLDRLTRLNENVPAAAVTAAAMLAGRTLEIAARFSKNKPQGKDESRTAALKRLLRKIRGQAPRLLDRLLAPGAGPGTAEFLLYWNRTILRWIGCGPVKRHRILERWKQKLDILSQHQGLGPSDRLWAAFAKLQNTHICDPTDKKSPARDAFPTYRSDPRAAKVAALARKALASASDEITRHALVSSAAEILAQTQGPKAAEKVLLTETRRSDTPWYYWAALAWLYEEEHDPQQALNAGARAAESARGRATRIQWQSSQVMRILRLAPETPNLASAVKTLLDLLLAHRDSWVGRNGDKVRRVTEAINALCSQKNHGPDSGKQRRDNRAESRNRRISKHIQALLSHQAARLRRHCPRHKSEAPCVALMEALQRLSGPDCLSGH